MKLTSSGFRVSVYTCLYILFISGRLNAQDTVSKYSLQEITITVSRMPEKQFQFPGHLSVINNRQITLLENINPDISQILGLGVPGMGLSTNTTNNRGQSLRGRNMLVMIDGIPQSTPLRPGARDIRTIDASAIEKIEVIRGATAIFGNGADGGIINFITKHATPGEKIHYTASTAIAGHPLHAGETGSPRTTQSISGNTGKISYYMAGTYGYTGVLKDAQGIPLAPFNGLGQTTNINVLANAQLALNDNQKISVMYNFFRSMQQSNYITLPGEYLIKPSIGIPGQDSINPGTPYNHNAYIKYNVQKIGRSNTSLEIAGIWQHFRTIYDYTIPRPSQLLSNKKGIRLTLQTSSRKSALQCNIAYGADLLNDITSQPTLDGTTWVPEMNFWSAAPFIQSDIHIKQQWVIRAGARYDFIRIKVPTYHTLPINAATNAKEILGGTLNNHLPVFNAGVRFTKLPFFAPFISFSQGYSMADLGRSLRATIQPGIIKSINIQPAVTNNYEAGFNTTFRDFNFLFTYFMSRSQRGLYLTEDPETGILHPERVPENIYGWQMELGYRPAPKVDININYAHTEGKIKEAGNHPRYITNDRISPSRLNMIINYVPVPRLNMTLHALYTASRKRFDASKPVKNNDGAITGYSWFTNEGPVNSLFLTNLSAGYKPSDNLKCGIGIENLLNNNYYTLLSQFSADNRAYVKGNGMRMTISLQYDFIKKRPAKNQHN